MVAMIGAAILLLVGLGLSFHLKLWQALTEIIYDKVHLKLPPPLLCLLTCFAVLGGIYGWLNNHYPADSIIFKDKPLDAWGDQTATGDSVRGGYSTERRRGEFCH